MAPRKYQQKSLIFLLITSTSPWKLMMLIQSNTTQVSSAQLWVVSNSQLFYDINIFTYIIPVKCKVQIINFRKSPEKGFGIFIVNIPKTNIIISLWTSYYILQYPQI